MTGKNLSVLGALCDLCVEPSSPTVAEPTLLACLASSALIVVSSQQLVQRGNDDVDAFVGHAGRERQRQRRFGDALGDRAPAGLESESIAVIRLQVPGPEAD